MLKQVGLSNLVFVRHGESVWNAKGLWTGWTDIELSKKGKKEAEKAAVAIKDIDFHLAFTSDLKRAKDTLNIILRALKKSHIPIYISAAIRERHYGEYTGKNKWEIKKKVGEEKFKRIRRGWDEPINLGESLKHVYDRVIPHYLAFIKPHIVLGKNILFVAHGNSNRSLIKHLENVPDDKIAEIEMATGEVLVYKLDKKGKVVEKQKRSVTI
ncbi:2,3-bisphosphoglycerate-dependent phosphoglycerate mutase [Candidatus Gottesmanbacteria bacterium]|nr:2,3-bisphosphoglycerate-dependent phosphoglycerate mutase [Candidatus Gottesmanbacteria bacterium]